MAQVFQISWLQGSKMIAGTVIRTIRVKRATSRAHRAVIPESIVLAE